MKLPDLSKNIAKNTGTCLYLGDIHPWLLTFRFSCFRISYLNYSFSLFFYKPKCPWWTDHVNRLHICGALLDLVPFVQFKKRGKKA